MRSMLDNLMQKLNSDKAFLKSVVTYASGQVLKNGKLVPHNDVHSLTNHLDRHEEKTIDPERILETGLDDLSTLRQAREQLLKERVQFQQILSHYEHRANRYKKQNCDYKKRNSELVAELGRKTSASNARVEPEPQLNSNASITHNPFWVCGTMSDGAMCNGINQEWYLSRGKVDEPSRWTLRQICVKCRQTNKGNRRYLTDHEAQTFATYIGQQQTPTADSPQAQLFPLFQQHVVQSVTTCPRPVSMFSQRTTAMSPIAQHPMAYPPMAQQPAVQHPLTQYPNCSVPNCSVPQLLSTQLLSTQLLSTQLLSTQLLSTQLLSNSMAQHPVLQSMPITPPMAQHPVVQPTRTNPPIFTSKLAMPQIGPLPSYKSPYTPEPTKRKATEPPTDSPSPKRHPGFDISPAVQDTLRRELPQKEWMKPKKTTRVGPGTSKEPIALDEEATAGNSGASGESAPMEDDMASLFGDDENEPQDEFEAALCEALDEELRKDGRI